MQQLTTPVRDLSHSPVVVSSVIVESPAPQPTRSGRAAKLLGVTEAVLVAGYLILLATVLLRLAAHRQLWFDELFTLHLAKSGSVVALLNHLAAGVDLNPPLIYVLTWLSITVFGEVEWAVRLPGVLGGVAAVGLLYVFVRRRRGPAEAALAATAITTAGGVWDLFLDARPYGVVCGLAAAALVCWQRAGENGPNRNLWKFGLAGAFGLGMASHYYFCVVVMALGSAEALRWVYARRIDVVTVACFAVPVLVLAACYPLWSTAPKTYAGGFWAKTVLDLPSVQFAYDMMGGETAALSAAFALGLVAVVAALFGKKGATGDEPGYRPWEVVALAALAAAPVAGLVIGAKLAGGFYFRYTVASVLGLSGLLALACGRMAGSTRWAGFLAAAGLAVLGAPAQWFDKVRAYDSRAGTLQDVGKFLNERTAGGTVVVESHHVFAPLWYYAPADRTRVVYLADTERGLRRDKVDTTDRGLIALRKVTDVPAVGWDELLRDIDGGKPVYYYGRGDSWQWHELRESGVRFEPVAERPDRKLYRLTKG